VPRNVPGDLVCVRCLCLHRSDPFEKQRGPGFPSPMADFVPRVPRSKARFMPQKAPKASSKLRCTKFGAICQPCSTETKRHDVICKKNEGLGGMGLPDHGF